MKDLEKGQKISDAMNGIGDDLIRDAEDHVPQALPKKKNGWVKWVGIAVAACLMLAAIPFALQRWAPDKGETHSSTDILETKNYDVISTEVICGSEYSKPPVSPVSIEGDLYEGAPEVFYKADGTAGVTGSPSGSMIEGKEGITPSEALPDDPGTASEPMEEVKVPDAHQLTAAAWNDNEHYLMWQDLFVVNGQNKGAVGKFSGFSGAGNDWHMNSQNRVKVSVVCAGAPAAGASVCLMDGETVTFSAKTDANGIVYLFGTGTSVSVTDGESTKTVTVDGQKELTVEVENIPGKENIIEIMYVIDVTGSMGDELSYLKSELENVVKRVVAENTGVRIRLSILCYRDDGDEEKFFYVDFLDVTDPEKCTAMLNQLRKVDAHGGGDYEEAVDEALEMAVTKYWSPNTTKLMFHVLDAPAHSEDVFKTRLSNAVKKAAETGIRICPVVASGADEVVEYTCRSEAILTGGTYVYLTDDSGIGGVHLDPHIPDAVHEYLDDLMVRLINGYHTGTFTEPVAWSAK